MGCDICVKFFDNDTNWTWIVFVCVKGSFTRAAFEACTCRLQLRYEKNWTFPTYEETKVLHIVVVIVHTRDACLTTTCMLGLKVVGPFWSLPIVDVVLFCHTEFQKQNWNQCCKLQAKFSADSPSMRTKLRDSVVIILHWDRHVLWQLVGLGHSRGAVLESSFRRCFFAANISRHL